MIESLRKQITALSFAKCLHRKTSGKDSQFFKEHALPFNEAYIWQGWERKLHSDM